MTTRDRVFAAGALGLTVLVPGLLLAGAPFVEERATLGTLAGWSVALLMMVPSYLLLARAAGSENPHHFLSAFMVGTLLRLGLAFTAVLLFTLLLESPPVRSFVLAFALGYMLLTCLELTLVLRGSTSAEERS